VYFKDSPEWLRRVSLWHEDSRPVQCGLGQVGSRDGFPWFELVCGADGAGEVFEALREHCPGLTLPMLEDLLTPDESPEGETYGDEPTQLASTFSLVAERDETPTERGAPLGVGKLIFQPVEILAGDDWLISCWHPTRTFEGSDKVDGSGPPGSAEAVFRGAANRWCRGQRRSPGDLGIAVMNELADSYGPAQHELMLWLEDWELSLYRHEKKVDEKQLAALWGLMAVMRKWLTPLSRPALCKDIAKAWLPATDHDATVEVAEVIAEALADLGRLSDTLRQAFGLLHVEQAEEQRRRDERSARRLEKLAAVFLVPTLVVGFYGANTWVPGQNRHWGFYVMVGVLALLSCVTMFTLRSRREGRSAADRPSVDLASQPALRR
jgi:Mg2+ and Co2+ transporter CorA